MGLYAEGRLIRGAHGLAGEIGYLATSTGPAQYSTLVKTLGQQGFGTPDSAALDVPTIRRSLGEGPGAGAGAVAGGAAQALGAAVGQVIVATCAVVDPDLVLLGGALGRHPALFDTACQTVSELFPSPVRIEPGLIAAGASLHGAVHLALDRARADLLVP
jgi:predicted NBD/HSP70 family sugar kinase